MTRNDQTNLHVEPEGERARGTRCVLGHALNHAASHSSTFFPYLFAYYKFFIESSSLFILKKRISENSIFYLIDLIFFSITSGRADACNFWSNASKKLKIHRNLFLHYTSGQRNCYSKIYIFFLILYVENVETKERSFARANEIFESKSLSLGRTAQSPFHQLVRSMIPKRKPKKKTQFLERPINSFLSFFRMSDNERKWKICHHINENKKSYYLLSDLCFFPPDGDGNT